MAFPEFPVRRDHDAAAGGFDDTFEIEIAS